MMDGSLTSGKSRTHLRDYVDGSDKVKEHLLFGVKRNLIKLIGNLCYKSRRCQDKVSSLSTLIIFVILSVSVGQRAGGYTIDSKPMQSRHAQSMYPRYFC